MPQGSPTPRAILSLVSSPPFEPVFVLAGGLITVLGSGAGVVVIDETVDENVVEENGVVDKPVVIKLVVDEAVVVVGEGVVVVVGEGVVVVVGEGVEVVVGEGVVKVVGEGVEGMLVVAISYSVQYRTRRDKWHRHSTHTRPSMDEVLDLKSQVSIRCSVVTFELITSKVAHQR
jgi:hypothetical protein